MPERDWAELTRSDNGRPSLLSRTLWAVAAMLTITVGALLIYVLIDFNHEQQSSKRDVIHAGQVRLERSLDEEVRTQTLVCLAHPDQRRAQPLFDHMCSDVIKRWQVNSSVSP